MLVAALCTCLLVATPAPPGLPPEPAPPAGQEVVEPVRITALENAVVTLPAEAAAKLQAVQTADGPRVRITAGEVTIEATKLQVRSRTKAEGNLGTRVLKLHVGKDGKLCIESELEPDGGKPIPPPKQP